MSRVVRKGRSDEAERPSSRATASPTRAERSRSRSTSRPRATATSATRRASSRSRSRTTKDRTAVEAESVDTADVQSAETTERAPRSRKATTVSMASAASSDIVEMKSASPLSSTPAPSSSPSPQKEVQIKKTCKSLKETTITKMPEVEELVDYYIHRPIAGALVYLLLRLPFPLTPTQITLVSLVTGLAAAYFMLMGFYAGTTLIFPILSFFAPLNTFPVLGAYLPNFGALSAHKIFLTGDQCFLISAALLFVTSVVDCADGQYARATNTGSFTGRMTDGIVDMVVITCNSLAFCTGMLRWHGLLGFAATAIACICLQQHALVYDKVKNAFILHLKEDPELTPSAEHTIVLKEQAINEARWFDALILWVAFYYVSASQITVKTPESMEERLRFRDANSLTMRMAAYLGIGTQNAIWYVAIGATPFYRYAPWTFIALACGALLVLNIIVRIRSNRTFPDSCKLRFVEQELPPVAVWLSIGFSLIGMLVALGQVSPVLWKW